MTAACCVLEFSTNFRLMNLVQLFFLLCAVACAMFLAIGLYKPWIMLWWEDVQNRRKVIKVYGSIGLACYAIYWTLRLFV
jgi:hypothetical protein